MKDLYVRKREERKGKKEKGKEKEKEREGNKGGANRLDR